MTTTTTNIKMSSQQGKSKKEELVRDTSVYSTLNEEYLRHPSNYFITPLRSPIGFPNKKASQRRYFYLDVPVPGGVEEKATILLLHGFPDSSYGWRKIISPLSMSGYRLIVPDLLGYGRTSKPNQLEEYSARSMSFDLADLMTHVLQGKYQNKFAVVGHDWGSWLSWKLPLWIPDRLLGVHGICVSYVPPTQKFISTTQLAAKYPQFGYQMFFEEERSTKIIEEKIDMFLRILFIAPAKLVEKVDPEDVLKVFGAGKDSLEKSLKGGLEGDAANAFAEAFLLSPREKIVFNSLFDPRNGGSMDGLKWYRTRPINYEEEKALPNAMLPKLPYKMLCPNMDPTGPANLAEKARKFMPVGSSYSVEELEATGHWAMLERPEEVIASITQWMEKDVLPFHSTLLQKIISRL